MSDKCPRCGKTVYFAERRMYKGAYYHQLCSNKQQDDDLAGKKLFAFDSFLNNLFFKISYLSALMLNRLHEDMNCNPHDKPVNTAIGVPRSTIPPRHKSCTKCSFQLNDDCRFCPNCGAKAEEQQQPETQKPDPTVFCSGCGTRFPVSVNSLKFHQTFTTFVIDFTFFENREMQDSVQVVGHKDH